MNDPRPDVDMLRSGDAKAEVDVDVEVDIGPIISVDRLSKHFRVRRHHRGRLGWARDLVTREHTLVRAVDEVSFAIRPGELVGYLGPNGAGKSTTIKMLTGLLVPTGGELQVAGRLPWRERRRHVAGLGAVFGQRTTLWWDLPVIQSLELLRHVYRVPEKRWRSNLDDFRALLDLDVFIDTPVRQLSLGQRMRADLAAALLHDPPLLFLDEPTIGLDVVAKDRIRRFIRHVNAERGTTVLLTTHDLSDVEKLCRRVMIIDRGKLLYDGSLADLRARFGGRRELVVDLAPDAELDLAALDLPPGLPPGAVEIAGREGPRWRLAFERDALSASTLITALSAQVPVRDLEVREPDIEATVRRIYEERLLEGGGAEDEGADGMRGVEVS
jgi:ABC-2 type transport system ATP-binding protein